MRNTVQLMSSEISINMIQETHETIWNANIICSKDKAKLSQYTKGMIALRDKG